MCWGGVNLMAHFVLVPESALAHKLARQGYWRLQSSTKIGRLVKSGEEGYTLPQDQVQASVAAS